MEIPKAVVHEKHSALTSGTISHSTHDLATSDKYWRRWFQSFATATILAALVLTVAAYGFFRPIDDWLEASRFTLLNRPPHRECGFFGNRRSQLAKRRRMALAAHGSCSDRRPIVGTGRQIDGLRHRF